MSLEILPHILLPLPHRYRRLTRSFQDCGLADEALESVHDNVAVQRIKLHQECSPTSLLSANESRTRAAEQVQNILTFDGRILHRPDYRRLCNEVVRFMLNEELFVFVTETQVDGNNSAAERQRRDDAIARKTGRTSKTPQGAKRRSVIGSV